MKKIAFLFILCTIIVGCRTTTTSENNNSDVVQYVTKVEHDTLFERMVDSVYLEVMQKGDTVYRTKYKEVVKWRDRVVERKDTCYRDSIVKEYKEMVKEVKYVPKVYHVSMCISILVLILAMLKIAWWIKSKSVM